MWWDLRENMFAFVLYMTHGFKCTQRNQVLWHHTLDVVKSVSELLCANQLVLIITMKDEEIASV